MGFYFTLEVLIYLDLFSVSVGIKTCPCLICYECVQFQIEIQEISHFGSRSPNNAEFGHFTLLFSRGRQRNQCTKNYNARAQLLCCSLSLLFGDVLVAVAFVFCVRSLIESLSLTFTANGKRQKLNFCRLSLAL